MALSPEVELDLRVTNISPVAHDVITIDFALPDGGELPEWTPGSHIELDLPNGLVRQYSLCGDPADRSVWRVAVLRETDGRGGSAWLHSSLSIGDTLTVRGPRNHFAFDAAPQYRFVAAGIGITPLIPMIHAASAAGAQWSLDYVGKSREKMAFAGELLEKFPEQVTVHARTEVARPDLAALIDGAGHGTLIYACGPSEFLAGVEAACTSLPSGSLRVEHFSPKELGDLSENVSFEVELASSGTIIPVSADQSILDALRESGMRVLSSCQEGTCGTCETTIIEGTVEHRDSLLTPEEQASNETMMICVSRATCPRLVLDL